MVYTERPLYKPYSLSLVDKHRMLVNTPREHDAYTLYGAHAEAPYLLRERRVL